MSHRNQKPKVPQITTQTNSAKIQVILAIGLVCGLFLRMAYVLEMNNFILFKGLVIDAEFYDTWAQNIIRGINLKDWTGLSVLYQDPLYAYFLSLIYAVIGRSFLIVRLIQVVLDVSTCYMLYLIGVRLLNRYAGLIALWIYALYGPAVFYTGLLDKTSFTLFLMCASLLSLSHMFTNHRFRDMLLAGFLLGLAALSRGNLILTVPFIVAGYLISTKGILSWKAKAAHMGAFVFASAAIVFCVTIRNYAVAGDIVLLTANSGFNFFIGNNPNANGVYKVPPFIVGTPDREYQDSKNYAERFSKRKLDHPSQVSAFWLNEALGFIKQHPTQWLRLVWTKLILCLKYLEIPETYSFDFFKENSTTLKLAPLTYGILCPLALIGFIISFRDLRMTMLVSFSIGYLLSLLLLFVTGRYRMPLVLPFTLFAANACTYAAEVVSRKRWKAVATLVLGCMAFMIFVNMDTDYMKNKILTGAHSTSYTIMGAVYQREKQYPNAAKYFQESLKYNSNNAEVLARLADIYDSSGRYDDALAAYQKAIQILPDFDEAYNNMGFLYARLGVKGKAVEAFKTAYELRPQQEVYKQNYERMIHLK